MRNHPNRVTKQKWYVPGKFESNPTQHAVELFRSPKKVFSGDEYYYKEEETSVFVSNLTLKKAFFKKKYRCAFLPNKGILKSVKVYVEECEKDKTIYVKKELSDLELGTTIFKIYAKNKVPDYYTNKVGITGAPRNGKSTYGLTHNVYQMMQSEADLMRKRATFSRKVNAAVEKLYKDLDVNEHDLIIKDEDLDALFDILKKFSLNRQELITNPQATLDYLIDEQSKPGYKPISTAKTQFEKDLYQLINTEIKKKQCERNENRFKQELNKRSKEALLKEQQRLHTTLFQYVTVRVYMNQQKENKIISLKFDEKLFDSVLEDVYQVDGLLKKVNQAMQKNKKVDSADISLFGIIREHYQTEVKGKIVESNPEQNEYLKHIHNYLLGRARKIKKLAQKDKKLVYSSLEIRNLFKPKKLKKKIRASVVNKKFLQEVKQETLKTYDETDRQDYQSLILQQKKLLDTFKMKLSNSVYASVNEGLVTVMNEASDVFGKRNLEGIKNEIEKLNIKKIDSKEKLNHIYGAYFIRNYTLHNQVFNLNNKKDQKIANEYKTTLAKQLEENQTTVNKEKLIAYELERLSFNNVLTYYEEEKIQKLFNLTDSWTTAKNSALPRFDRVFNKLAGVERTNRLEDVSKRQAIRCYLQRYYEYGFLAYLENSKNHKTILSEYEKKMNDKFKEEQEDTDKPPVTDRDRSINVQLFLEIGVSEYRRQKLAIAGSDESAIEQAQQKFIRLIRDLFEIVCEKQQFNLPPNASIVVPETKQALEKEVTNLLCSKISPVELVVDKLELLPLAIYSCAQLADIAIKSVLIQNIDRLVTLEASLANQYSHWQTAYDRIMERLLVTDGINCSFSVLKEQLLIVKEKLREEVKLDRYKNLETFATKTTEINETKKLEEMLLENINAISSDCKKYDKLEDVIYQKKNDPIQLWKQGRVETKDGSKIIPRTFILEEYRKKTLTFDFKAHMSAMEQVGLRYDNVLNDFSAFYQKEKPTDQWTKLESLMQRRQALYKKKQELGVNEKKEFKNIQEEICKFNFYSNLVTYNQLRKNKRFFELYYTRFYTWNRAAETLKRVDEKNTHWEKIIAKQINLSKGKSTSPIKGKLIREIRNDTAHLNQLQTGQSPQGIASLLVLQQKYKKTFNEYLVRRRNEVKPVEVKILKKFNLTLTNGKFRALVKTVKHKGFFALACEKEVAYYNALYNFHLKGEQK